MRILSQFDRDHLEHAIEVMLALLDAKDGDLDIEPSGDELDGCGPSEDEFLDFKAAGIESGPGCPLSDPGGGDVNDEGEAVNEDGEPEIMATLPLYGLDQSLGPINENAPTRSTWRSCTGDGAPQPMV